jgi:hypothetical protein
MATTDINVEIVKLQQDIETYIGGIASKGIIFNYEDKEGEIKLDVITVNPKHNQSFLFQTVMGYNKIDALKNMLDYVKNYKEKESSFTVQWSLKESNELHTSYFRAKNILEALDKFYYDRDLNSTIVFSIKLNPIS